MSASRIRRRSSASVLHWGCSTGAAADEVKEYATGSSGLQFDGNGNWQINWKTPKAYVGQCRTMYLNLTNFTPDTPTSETAHFQFK